MGLYDLLIVSRVYIKASSNALENLPEDAWLCYQITSGMLWTWRFRLLSCSLSNGQDFVATVLILRKTLIDKPLVIVIGGADRMVFIT